MKLFRLPRKTRKKLKGKLWMYPADDKGNHVMAWPGKHQKDYTAIKTGIVTQLLDPKNAKVRRSAYKQKMNKEIFVDDSDLKNYIDEIFAEQYRFSSYNTFISAKNNPKAMVAYFNFINAYNLYKNGEESMSNTCCMAVDHAKDLLKTKRK